MPVESTSDDLASSVWAPRSSASAGRNLWSSSSLSCILHDQEIMATTGPVRAADVVDAFERGEIVRLAASPHEADPIKATATTVVAACRTTAPAVELVYTDGRSVRLTTGHAVPSGSGAARIIAGRPELRFRLLQGGEATLDAVRPIRPGDWLGDGVVSDVRDLGVRPAVRLWVTGPEWLLTPSGLRIGTRWHEVCGDAVLVQAIPPAEFFDERPDGPHWREVLAQQHAEYARCGRVLAVATLDERCPPNDRNTRAAFDEHSTRYHGPYRVYGDPSYRITDDHTDPEAHWRAVARQALRRQVVPQSVLWCVSPEAHLAEDWGALPDALHHRDVRARVVSDVARFALTA